MPGDRVRQSAVSSCIEVDIADLTAHQHTLPLNNGVVGSSSAAVYMVTTSETTGDQNV